MPRKFLPAKILVNRAVELKQLQHPREKLLRRLNVALGSVTLIGLVALTILFPRILVFTYAAFFVLGLMFWLRAGFKRARFYGRSSLVTDANGPNPAWQARQRVSLSFAVGIVTPSSFIDVLISCSPPPWGS